jgi:hypothetical protein
MSPVAGALGGFSPLFEGPSMPKFNDPFLSYYEQERAYLLRQLEDMRSGKWKVFAQSVDITSQCIEYTEGKLVELDALADELAGDESA